MICSIEVNVYLLHSNSIVDLSVADGFQDQFYEYSETTIFIYFISSNTKKKKKNSEKI